MIHNLKIETPKKTKKICKFIHVALTNIQPECRHVNLMTTRESYHETESKEHVRLVGGLSIAGYLYSTLPGGELESK